MLHKRVFRFFLVSLFTTTLLLGAYPGQASAQTANVFPGTWGYVMLGRGLFSSWYNWKTEAGTITFNNDWSPAAPGTAVTTFAESADICPDQNFCMASDTQTHTYTLNPDGSATLDGFMKLVLSNDGKVAIGDTSAVPGEQIFFVGVKMAPAHTYTLAEAVGTYYSGSYEHDALGNPPPNGGGQFRLASVISSMAGDGTISMAGTVNGDGTLYNIPMPGADPRQSTGTYSVDPSGRISMWNGFGEPAGYGYSPEGTVGVFSNALGGTRTDFRVNVVLRKQDRTYSTADLQGTWAVSTFSETGGSSFRTEFGAITCDNVGSCSASLKTRNNNDVISDTGISLSLSAAADGSLNGFYLTNAMPHFSGAIGNNGNTMALTVNTGSQNTDDRSLWIAVKTSPAPAAATGCATFNLLTNTLHIPSFNPGSPPTYWLDLAIRPSNALSFQLSNFGENAVATDNQATFNLFSMAFHVPCLDLGSLPTYWLDLAVADEGGALVFNLSDFGAN